MRGHAKPDSWKGMDVMDGEWQEPLALVLTLCSSPGKQGTL